MKKFLAITAASAAATLTLGAFAAAPAMAKPCRFHDNPPACRARRQMRHLWRQNRELRQELRYQNGVNGPGWGAVYAPGFGGGGRGVMIRF